MKVYYQLDGYSRKEDKAEGATNSRRSLASLFLYMILRRDTSPTHPITQKALLERLKCEYGIEMGRQSAGRILKALSESEMNIFYDAGNGSALAWYSKHPW